MIKSSLCFSFVKLSWLVFRNVGMLRNLKRLRSDGTAELRDEFGWVRFAGVVFFEVKVNGVIDLAVLL